MSSSPTVSHCDSLSSGSNSSTNEATNASLNTTCSQCHETFTIPKVLTCFHTFCQPCLEKTQEVPEKITCPQCHHDSLLSTSGLSGLLPDYAVSAVLQQEATSTIQTNGLNCTGCKSKDSNAVARCSDCANFLCPNCVMAHQFMHCFEGHRVKTLTDLQEVGTRDAEKPVLCTVHRNEPMKFFCRSCNKPVCQDCAMSEHQSHGCEPISDIGGKHMESLQQLIGAAKVKATNLRGSSKGLEHTSNRLQVQYHKAQNEITETFNFYRTMLEERKTELLKELESAYNTKQLSINGMMQKVQDSSDKLFQGCDFIDKIIKHANITEVLMFKQLLDSKMQVLMGYVPDPVGQSGLDLEFVSNYQAIQAGVRNTFGYVRQDSEVPPPAQKPQPIARPNGFRSYNKPIGSHMSEGMNGPMNGGMNPASHLNGSLNGPVNGNIFESDLLGKRYDSNSSLNSLNSLFPVSQEALQNPYDKWSTGGMDILQNGTSDIFSTSADPLINEITSKLITSANMYPPKSQIKRQKMIYHCKFGEFGVMEGQFTEPSGVAVNAQNDIVVADTNNHRIQIFDKEGRFKFQFGECGKRDGQLLYPNRVAVIKNSGDIVVTERSPTHQVQIYNQYGQFVRKFGANILQHPRGVTVDNKGRIIIVECKVMRVIIFDQHGNVLQKFGCSKHLEFPNGVVVNDKEEIFISDNRAHCVKVFSYQGVYLRQIGGEGITNYPIGVGINSVGEILIADNHNNFNLTIFTQDGNLVNALESKVKHAQCFDVALLDDGSIVLASKDYRLYVYRYLQVPNLGFGLYPDNMMDKLYGMNN